MEELIVYEILTVVFILIALYIFSLRRIVPTNMVHIIQRGKHTISYGKSHDSGNVYYEFPKWVPVIGIIVRELPVSNFDIDINDYVAYDKDRLPFMLHVKAFFHIADTNKAAEKVESYTELKAQLDNVVKGAIRSILANETLHKIMEERAIFGKQFTESVNEDLKQWGVEAVKNIELMDIKDDKTSNSNVIGQIMDMRKSSIDMESRTEIAKNKKIAEQNELQARKEVAVTTAETERLSGEAQARSNQAIGIAKAESAKMSGIAQQEAMAEVAKSEKDTAEKQMEVVRTKAVKGAEINKETAVIEAEQVARQMEINAEAAKKQLEIQTYANKMKIETDAEARKVATEKDALALLSKQQNDAKGKQAIGNAEAEVIKAKGLSEAESKKAMELAGVTAQTTLAEKIGENKEYQAYMIEIKKVEVSQVIGVAQAENLAKAMNGAQLKLLVNSGDVQSGIGKFSDLFTAKGGSQLNGLIETLSQTEAGKAIINLLPGIKQEKN